MPSLDFFERFNQHVESLPDQIALELIGAQGREGFTFRQIARQIDSIGRYLQQQGLGPGNTVGIVMENHPRWGIAFLAVQSCGARIVPFDVMHEAETLARLIVHAECDFLISSRAMTSLLEQIQSSLPEPLPALIAGGRVDDYGHWETVVKENQGSPQLPLVHQDLGETFLLVYTSGTTGSPKGVMLTQRAIYRNIVEVLAEIEVGPKDTILGVLPLYHMLALMANFIIPLYVGARVTYLDELEPQRILKAFREEGITIFVCVPQFFYLLHRRILHQVQQLSWTKRKLFGVLHSVAHFANHRLEWNPGRLFFGAIHRNFGQLRLFAVGGARFDPEVATALNDLGFNLVQAYGMTETAAVSTITPPASLAGLGSVGRPLPHVQLRVDHPDEEGIGEVKINGCHLMQGYWKNDKATGEVLNNGWLSTGDLGRLDADGFLHITGRSKDVIVLSSGKNIYPEEIEHAYEKRCPLIKEMCVLGLTSQHDGEIQEKLHAVIVPDWERLKQDKVVNAYEMIRYRLETISQQFPAFKRVLSLEIRRSPLPRTTTRKIKRFQIQKEVDERPPGAVPSQFSEATKPENPVEEKLFAMLREAGQTQLINRAMSLELDLGFDSLSRVEFLSNVQDAFGVALSDQAAVEIFTVEDLVTAVSKQSSGQVSDDSGRRGSWAKILQAPLRADDQAQIQRLLRRRPLAEVIYYLGTRIIHLLAKVLFRIRFDGTENLPRQYPFILCPNHNSYLDGFLHSAGLPLETLRRLFYLGYADYFSSGFTSYLGSLIKVVPVDPDSRLRQALRLGAHGLRQDLVLCVFPEGERSIDGTLKPFRQGPAILATELGVPVVPVSIQGTFEVWPRGSNKIRLHPVRILFGTPLWPGPSESYKTFNQRLFEAVEGLNRSRQEVEFQA